MKTINKNIISALSVIVIAMLISFGLGLFCDQKAHAEGTEIQIGNKASPEDALIKKGESLYRERKYSEAIVVWEEALATAPNDDGIKRNIKRAQDALDKQAKEQAKKDEAGRKKAEAAERRLAEEHKLKMQVEEQKQAIVEAANKQQAQMMPQAQTNTNFGPKQETASQQEVQAVTAEQKRQEEAARRAEERKNRQESERLAREQKRQERLDADARRKDEQERKRLEREEAKRSKWKGDVGLIGVTGPASQKATALSLQQCVDIAIMNNPGLKVAKESVKLAELRVWEAKRNLLPTAKLVFEDSSGKVNDRDYTGRKQYIEGQQSIFHGGELYFLMKQSEVNLAIVKKDYDRIENELILQVKKAYHSLVKSQENLRIQLANIDEVDKIAESVKKQIEAGAVSKLEAANVAMKTNRAHFMVVSAQGDVDVAELILKQAMNIDPRERITINQRFKFTKFDVDYDKVLLAAFLNRPEIRINAMSIEYYKYGKDVSKAKFWPKIDLMGSWGLAKEQYTDITDESEHRKLSPQWYAGVKASMPFWGNTVEYSHTREHWVPVVSAFQGTEAATNSVKVNLMDAFKDYSEKQAAIVDYERAQQEFNKVKQDVTLEVREQCFNYEKALVQINTNNSAVEYHKKDLEFTKFRRGMDEAFDSDVIESLNKLAAEEFGGAQSMNDYFAAVASLNKAIGVDDYFKIEEDFSSVAQR